MIKDKKKKKKANKARLYIIMPLFLPLASTRVVDALSYQPLFLNKDTRSLHLSTT